MKKKLLITISFLLLLIGGSFGLWTFYIRNIAEANIPEEPTPTSIFAQKRTPIYGKPERIYTGSASIPDAPPLIDAEVIQVGVDENGALEAPEDWTKTGWYENSSKTGENGNIVIDGHYDNIYGGAAAFWQLKNLKTSDKVYLVDSFKRVFIYEVIDVFSLDMSDPNRLQVLDSEKDKFLLTLITCNGVWVPSQGTYNQRLIVRAELVDSPVQE